MKNQDVYIFEVIKYHIFSLDCVFHTTEWIKKRDIYAFINEMHPGDTYGIKCPIDVPVRDNCVTVFAARTLDKYVLSITASHLYLFCSES